MAFNAAHFAPLAGQTRRIGSPALWSYLTTDTLATCRAAGYFDNGATANTQMRTMLKVGDIIHIVVVDSVSAPTSVSEMGTLTVNSVSSNIIDTADPLGMAPIALNAYMADISAVGQIYVVSPVAGNVAAVYSVINGAITVADAVLTVKTGAGTVGTLTIAESGSAAGVVDSLTAGLANTAVAKGATVEIETDGGSTDTCAAMITVLIAPSLADTD
jgi:hypothetical protein